MRQRALLMVTIAASVLFAAPAHAQGWRWLEKLSGPGDFSGYELNVKVFCHYDTVAAPPDTTRFAVPISMPCLFKSAGKSEDATTAAETVDRNKGKTLHPNVVKSKTDGTFLDLSRRIDAIGVGVSYLRGAGDLEYPSTDEHVDRTVQLWAIEAFYDHRWTQRLDLGVATGANIFVVPEADTFVRWSAEPRVTLKLFDLRKGDTYAGSATLRIGALFLFGRFEDEDFGAIPGTYRSSSVDVGPSFRFVLDFDRNPFKSN